jgi:hypothetical protein
MLREAYGDDASSQMMTYEWFKRFKNGRTSTDDEQSGRHSASRSDPLTAQVKNMINGNSNMTLRKVAKEVGISTGSCHKICTKILH